MAVKQLLTARDEQILKSVAYYRYVTARDIAYEQFSKTSLNYTRERLTQLSGNTDLEINNYLCRFNLPTFDTRRPEKVFVLGAKGRRLLQSMGIATPWYFRPHKLKFLSYSYVLHNLLLTRTMIAAQCWAKTHPSFALTDKRISYELAGKVVPDAWLRFEESGDQLPILLEIDRGMEDKFKFRAHVRGRINYIQSGEYKRTFDTEYATIAYATTGQTEYYRETRRKAMCGYIAELLREMRLTDWAGNFKVASVEFGALYDNALFENEVWYRPDSSTAVRLFE